MREHRSRPPSSTPPPKTPRRDRAHFHHRLLDGDFDFSGLLALRDFLDCRQVLLDREPNIFKSFRFCFALRPATGKSRT